MNKKLQLIIGISLPIIVILFVVGSILIPRIFFQPKYDFIYTLDPNCSSYGCPYSSSGYASQSPYQVINGHISRNLTQAPIGQNNSFFKDTIHNTATYAPLYVTETGGGWIGGSNNILGCSRSSGTIQGCYVPLVNGSATITIDASDASPNPTISSWGGACSGQGATCTITISGPTYVTANFASPQLYRYFVSTDAFQKISFDDAQKLDLTDAGSAPDGTVITNGTYRGGLFNEILGGGGSSYGLYLKNGSFTKKIIVQNGGQSDYYYNSNFKLIGWVK